MAALGLAAEELRLVLLTLLARASLLAAATFLDAFLIDYDTSKSITPAERDQSAATGSTGSGLLRGWAVWDAVFFSDIAVRGYVYEQYYAFFPLLPALSRAAPLLLVPTAMAANLLAATVSTVLLYRLGVRLTRDRRLSAAACLFFAATPAAPFHVAPYSEALFALATLAAMYCLYCRDAVLTAVVAVAASCGLRSNGVVNAGFLGHYCLQRAVEAWGRGKRVRAGALALQAVLAAAVAVLPLLYFQYSAYDTFCRNQHTPTAASGNSGPALSHTAESGDVGVGEGVEGQRRGPGTAWPRPWCSSRLPYVYGFVQSEYWNVGFMRYWTLQQLPNFLLAAPVLLLSACGLAEYCAVHPRHVACLALWGPAAAPVHPAPEGEQQQQQQGQQRGEGKARDGEHEHTQTRVADVRSGGQGQGSDAAGRHRGPGRPEGVRQRRRGQLLPAGGSGDVPGREGAAGNAAGEGRAGDAAAGPAGAPVDGDSGGGSGGSGAGGSAGGAGRIVIGPTGFLSPDLAVMVYPWAFSLAVCISCMHVQVSTRLLLSSCPVLYWYMAHVWGGGGVAGGGSTVRGGGAGRGRSAGQGVGAGRGKHGGGCSGDGGSNEELGALDKSSGCGDLEAGGVGALGGRWLGAALWRWCLVYGWVGAVLFVNFMPWT